MTNRLLVVTRFARVWIETPSPLHIQVRYLVTRFARVWIETALSRPIRAIALCHPLRAGVD